MNMKSASDVMLGLEEYLNHIRNDYSRWTLQSPTDVRIRMEEEFRKTLHFEVGSKYIKVITTSFGGHQRSVHSFICRKPVGKFAAGDILTAAGWTGPARNFARGNILDRNFGTISWCGA
jgi:ribulose bisphosphate carboxylase small subunit